MTCKGVGDGVWKCRGVRREGCRRKDLSCRGVQGCGRWCDQGAGWQCERCAQGHVGQACKHVAVRCWRRISLVWCSEVCRTCRVPFWKALSGLYCLSTDVDHADGRDVEHLQGFYSSWSPPSCVATDPWRFPGVWQLSRTVHV